MLLALTTAQRVQTLKSFDLDYVTSTSSTVCFNKPERMKQTVDEAPTLYIPAFPDRPKLCVKSCYEEYKNRTEQGRQTRQLLVTTKEPHTAATHTTIAGWLRKTMQNAGLDPKVFTAHSTRAAASSKAAKFLPIPKVLQAVDWKTESVFRKHYQRPISLHNEFAITILTKR